MKNQVKFLGGMVALLAVSACSDAGRESMSVHMSDRPAEISCFGYHGELYQGRTTGRIAYDETGRISFVDAATGGYVVVEGECVVRYSVPRR